MMQGMESQVLGKEPEQRREMATSYPKERLAKMSQPFPHNFSKREMVSLEAICDTFLSPVPDRMAASLSLIGMLPHWVAGLMLQRLKEDKVRQIRIVLWLLSTRLGTLLLFGVWSLSLRFPYIESFDALLPSRREKALLSWASSRFISLRALFKALKSFCCSLYASVLDSDGYNPIQDALGYMAPSQRGAGGMSPASGPLASQSSDSDTSEIFSDSEDALLEDSLLEGTERGHGGERHGRHRGALNNHCSSSNMPEPVLRESVVDAAASGSRFQEELHLRGINCTVLNGTELKELEERVGSIPELTLQQDTGVQHIHCDAVIIGSGCGGSVIAAQLAQARPGSRVLVLEKGRYYAGEEFSQLEAPSMAELYEAGGFLSTDDGSLSVLTGSCVGGGSVVNWAASFRTPQHVRKEWVQEYGLKQFGTAEFDEAVEAVCARIGVNEENKTHNINNSALKEGCSVLGYPCKPIPRNATPPHPCGWCHFGCREGGKHCTATTWLHDAVRHGAVIMSSTRAERLLFSSSPNSDNKGRSQRAVGLVAVVDNGNHPEYAVAPRRIIIEAPIVVVACGSLHTPTLLLRSGLKNPNIGTHLRLHPVATAWGYFPEEGPELRERIPGRNPEGGIMTMFSGVVGNWNSSGYGALIQTPCAHPGLAAAGLPWHGKEEYMTQLMRYNRTALLIVITRDTGRGKVYLDKQGQLSFDYELNALDTKSLQDGVRASLNILKAAGAYEVGTSHQAFPLKFDCSEQHTEFDYEDFLKRVQLAGVGKNEVPIFSAHQLGSCPMGVNPKISAVDENGESWEVSGLFLGDASVLPSPSGVNPMVTIESVAYLTGSRLANRFSQTNVTQREARRLVEPKM